jgi:hypothetical protein
LTRRRRLLLLAVLFLAGLAYAFAHLAGWSRDAIASGLAGFFHRPATVGSVRFHLVPLEAEILDLRVGGYTPEAPPFLEIPRTVVTPSLAALWGRRLVLSRVRAEGLKVRVHAFPDPPEGPGGDDIPSMGNGGGGGGLDVSVSRVVIQQGEFIVDHARVPLDLELPDFHGRLLARRGGGLEGNVSFGPGKLQFGTAPPLVMSTEIDLSLNQGLITVPSAHLRAPGTDLAYHGQIRLAARPQGRFQLTGPVDLEMLDRHVMRTGFGLKGATRWDGLLSVDGSHLRIEGRAEGTGGVFKGMSVPRFGGLLKYDGDGLDLHDLQLEALGGTATLDIQVPNGPEAVRLSGPLRGVDAEGLIRLIFDVGEMGLGAGTSGDFAVSWPKGKPRQISGRFAMDLEPRADLRTPLSGRVEWSAEKGVEKLELADLKTPATRARLSGRIEVDDRADLALDGESTALADTDDLLRRLRRALGNPAPELAGVSGSGVFHGRWTGTLQLPVFGGRFTGQEFGYRGVVWGGAEWVGVLDADSVSSRSLVLRRGGGEIWLDGRAETGDYGAHDGNDLSVRLRAWPAADVAKALDWKLNLGGLLSGDATIRGRRSAPDGSARVTSPEGRYYGIPYADLAVVSRWRGPLTEITSGLARIGGGGVRFRGSLSDDGLYDGAAEVEGVDVDSVLPPLTPQIHFGGRVSGRIALQGPLTRPRLRGSLSSPRLFVGDEGLGSLEATLTGSGDGRLAVTARCRSPRVDLSLGGTVGADAPYEGALRLEARDTSLDPFLRAPFPSLPSLVGIVATGSLDIRGPLRAPRDLALDATLPEVQVQLPEYPIRNREPLHVTVAGGHLDLRAVHMAGEGTDLVVEGGADLLGQGPLRVGAKGAADLRTLSVIMRNLRGRGAARLAVEVGGTLGAPKLAGTLTLEGAGVRVRGFPHGLDDVHGTVRFTESAAELVGLTGTLAGGAVELEGQAAYAAGQLKSFDIRPSGRDMALRYPEGLRSLIDADLRLFGDASRQWITGTVDVKQAVWTRRYDLATELLSGGGGFEQPESLGEGVRYDLKVRAPGTLHIDNNLATLQARADLVVQGTFDAPVLLGRAEVDRGRVYFQGRTYVIRRGTIVFSNPQRTDPLFNIEAETRVRSYQITLKLGGTLKNINSTLTSDPPLAALQILNLLAGADESAVASLTQAQSAQWQLAATGAASLATGRLAEEVGLERGAERVFGLNRFSIDPALLRGATTNPTARLTVGKRLTADLSVLYSVDLRGVDGPVLSVEYTLSDRLSILLTQSQLDGLGFDILLRHTK